MTTPPLAARTRRAGRLAACLTLLALIGGCTSSLLPKPPQQPSLYSLNDALNEAPPAAAPRTPAATRPTLIVNPPRAAAGFDTSHIVYLRAPHQIEYFAHNQWVDTPAQMLAPLIVRALERSGAFSAVLLAPTAAAGQLKLDTEVVRLQQEFGSVPSQAHFTLRAVLLDSATRRVVAVREFDASVPAPSEDAPGGVSAANQAVQRVLGELAAFAAQAAATP
ncbi:MAG: ABC-type transport auxiliary lipoprotein family protein [Rhizobacter sp.]|nr:ABC-type transport auxiliary lipoprotein family protein [Rhizobacter sp.]